jgi:hypothetical protein
MKVSKFLRMYPVHWRTDALKFVARNLDLRIGDVAMPDDVADARRPSAVAELDSSLGHPRGSFNAC